MAWVDCKEHIQAGKSHGQALITSDYAPIMGQNGPSQRLVIQKYGGDELRTFVESSKLRREGSKILSVKFRCILIWNAKSGRLMAWSFWHRVSSWGK